jgi:DNA-binding NtrC family response regulator
VVDDDLQVLSVVRRVLARDHDVVVVDSGAAARNLLERDARFDAILCDRVMEGVSGGDLYGWIEARDPGLARRFVLMTGDVFSGVGEGLQRPIIAKPFNLSELRAVIGRVVDGE